MVCFKTTIQKFDRQGEKSGWTYVPIPVQQAELIRPGVKTTYRVKGKLDDYPIRQVAILPMGDGSFILPLNAALRKGTRKAKGAEILVQLEMDTASVEPDSDFMECLNDEPTAMEFFQSLAQGHRNYFSKWIQSARTEPTKAKRIALAVNALAKRMGFPEMLREQKAEKLRLGR